MFFLLLSLNYFRRIQQNRQPFGVPFQVASQSSQTLAGLTNERGSKRESQLAPMALLASPGRSLPVERAHKLSARLSRDCIRSVGGGGGRKTTRGNS